MTLRNRLIMEAKAKPAHIKLRPCDVDDVVEHVSLSRQFYGLTREEVRALVLSGKVLLMGVPLLPPASMLTA